MNGGIIGGSYLRSFSRSGVWTIGDVADKTLETAKCRGFAVVGSPTISEGVYSGISASNYLYIPYLFLPGTAPWRIETGFKLTGYQATAYQNIFEQKVANMSTPQTTVVGTDKGNKLRFDISYTKSSWNITVDSANAPELDTEYWLQFEYTGSAYRSLLSTNGVDFSVVGSANSTTACYQGNESIFSFGLDASTPGGFFGGYLYLRKTKIYINNQLWWRP